MVGRTGRGLVALLLGVSGCAFELTGHTPAADQVVEVGDTVTMTITYENHAAREQHLSWSSEDARIIQLIGDEETIVPGNTTGTDSRDFLAIAEGHTNLDVFSEHLGVTVGAAADTDDTDDTDSGGDPLLTLNLYAAGSVTTDPAGLECTNESFDPETPKTCSARLPAASYLLTATPNTDFGFTQSDFTGCPDTANRCTVDLTGDVVIDVRFTD
jgi:hypothetical protein